MRIRYRLMLGAGVALIGALVMVALWPAPSVPPTPVEEGAPSVESAAAPPAPEPVPEQVAARVAEEPVLASTEPDARMPPATVVALGPGDVAPEPEVEGAPAQENDEIPPELPQTAQWRLEKTTHITALLGRDVERLERELEDAESRGDEQRTEQLRMLIQRNRARLHELREEIRELGDAVKEESSEE